MDTGRVSEHNGVLVGRRTCQWAEGCDNVFKSLSVGSKAFQVAQYFLLNTSMYDWTTRCFKPAAVGKNSGSKVNLRKARRRRKIFETK